jgi:YggT family protein
MSIVCALINIWLLCLFVRIIMSWIPFDRSRRGLVSTVAEVIFAITEPVLGPLRRALPMLRVGSMGFDLSPIIVIIGISIIQRSILHC